MSTKRLIAQISKILGAVLIILLSIALGFEISKMRALAKSANTLNEFCGSLKAGTPQSEVAALVQQQKEFKFRPKGDRAFITLHTCHCTVGFKEDNVSIVSGAICND